MRYEIPAGNLRAELEGEEVLLNPTTGVYHLINATGRRLVAAFEEGRTFDEAVDELARESRIPVERARADADEFVQQMVERGLLSRVD